MKKRIIALFTALLLVFTCLTAKRKGQTVSVYAANDSYQRKVAELVNHERIANGLRPLLYSRQLSEVANRRAEELAQMGTIQHVRPDGSSYDTIYGEYGLSLSLWGENTARYYQTPYTVMYGDGIGGKGWMNSSSHYANIMKSGYVFIGIGVTTDSSGKLYWVQEFASGSLTGSYILSDEDRALFESSTTTKATTTTTKKATTTTKAATSTTKTTASTTATSNVTSSTISTSAAGSGTLSTSPVNPGSPNNVDEIQQEEQLGFFARLWKIICDFFASLFGHGDNSVKAG